MISEIFIKYLDLFSQWTVDSLNTIGMSNIMTSLIVDGIITGVGGILTFLPNIAILFLALAFLEDSGYMSRVAYIMNGIMEKIGLSGKASIPMILGFGCTVPAVMASRTLENEKDRLKTILITPFMSCSAKIPIYVLFAKMFFPKTAPLVAFSMYIIGLAVAIIIALVMSKLDKDKSKDLLLIELPEYKTPDAGTVIRYVWEKVKEYLTKAGTTIFVASIIIWALLNFGTTGMVENISDSFGAKIGEWLVPILKPAGLGYWQIAVSLISGLAAKETVISSMNVLYGGTGNMLSSLTTVGFNAVNAFAFMTFCLLYVPCMATLATIKKETNSIKWTMCSVLLQIIIAWLIATLIYQVGSLF